MRTARVALFVVTGLMLGAGVAAAQADLAKSLVGTWQGELQMRLKKGADPSVAVDEHIAHADDRPRNFWVTVSQRW